MPGLDLSDLGTVMALREDSDLDVGRKAFKLKQFLTNWQESFTAVEKVSLSDLLKVLALIFKSI